MTVLFRRFKLPFSRPFIIFLLGFLFGLFGLTFIKALFSLFEWNTKIGCEVASRHERANPSQIDTHANGNGLVLLGVMTAAKYVDSRAYNVWRTWAHSTPGRVFFFVSENTTSKYADTMPIIRLLGVNDVYPPQKKSFAMIKWMYDNYLDEFQWFMRADDDLYVRNEKLQSFLRSLDANKAHMIGQAGLGKGGEYGQLSLGAKDNYCMGGPGVILSREALRAVGPHLEECLAELATGHEDVELGRCVRKYVGITCTWNYEMQTLFHNNQTSGWSANAAVTGDFRRVITLHPIKNPDLMRKVHIHAQSERLNELRARKIALLRELRAALPSTTSSSSAANEGGGDGGGDDEGGAALPPPLRSPSSTTQSSSSVPLIRRVAKTTRDLTHWDYVSLNKLLFCADQVNCPRHTIDANTRSAINNIIVHLFDKFNLNARQRGRILQFRNVQYGYMRVEPRYGVDYVLDIVLWFKKLRPARTLSVRRHAYVQQTFGPIEALSDSEYRQLYLLPQSEAVYNTLNSGSNRVAAGSVSTTPVYIVMALQGRAEIFRRFSHNLRQILPVYERSVKIVIVLYRCQNETENILISETVGELSRFLPLRVVDMELSTQGFSRGQALRMGASSVPPDSLLFFADVDMLFSYDTIQRIRLNTIYGVQVYFPIIFSEYSREYWLSEAGEPTPALGTFDADSPLAYAPDRGYFRSFGFGIVSIFASDFHRVGGFNLTIHGWGLEDVDFFERCVQSYLRVLRAPDPSLVHVSHPIQCNRAEMPPAQYKMCVGTKAASVASHDFLARQIMPHF